MNRYERITELSNIKFEKNIPLFIEKGAILEDLLSGRKYLQLKFLNSGNKRIRNLYIRFLCKNSVELDEELIEYKLTDIMVESGKFFGTKDIILLPTNYKSIRFSEIIIEYDDGEGACYSSSRYFVISKSQNSSVLPLVSALLIFFSIIFSIIRFRDFSLVYELYLLLVLALVLRKKNFFLVFSLGILGVYTFLSSINTIITFLKYDISHYWTLIIANLILSIVCILLCVFTLIKDKHIIKKIWFVPGILYIISLIISYFGDGSFSLYIYTIVSFVLGIIQLISFFLIGYWVCQEN